MNEPQSPEVWSEQDEKDYQEVLTMQQEAWNAASLCQDSLEMLRSEAFPKIIRGSASLILGELSMREQSKERERLINQQSTERKAEDVSPPTQV